MDALIRCTTPLALSGLLFTASTAVVAQATPPQPSDPLSPVQTRPQDEGASSNYPRMGSLHELMLSPDVWFRFGLLAQVWGNEQQSATRVNGNDGGYSLDLYLRHARLIVVGQFFEKAGVVLVLDETNAGKAVQTGTGATAVVSKFPAPTLSDAFAEVKVAGDRLMIEGGLMVIPVCHGCLLSPASLLTLDVPNVVGVVLPTGTEVGRDTGFQLKGYELDDKLELRVGLFSGLRESSNTTTNTPLAANAPRISGHVQYQLFDPDNKGYLYTGQALGKKKLLGLSAGFDFQKGDNLDAYKLFSGGAFGALPISGQADPKGGDEIAFQAEYFHYDGGSTFPSIVRQNDLDTEVSYYNHGLSFSVFAKFEVRQATADVNKAQNGRWIGGGLKYFVAGINCTLTLAYNRASAPSAPQATTNPTNQVTLQLQVFYF